MKLAKWMSLKPLMRTIRVNFLTMQSKKAGVIV
jgi:hypothetical protein